MNSPKVELLAPAGNYDSFIGAINAGADAVYVGGEKFSARAFADNFDTDTLCRCIRYAHLFGRRVYLTLNTLIKESEFSEIYDYVLPFYCAGLDGVIIQDFGVLKFLKENFPYMELHASTQMAVTGEEFVSLCKEWGISRVVPARELSLSELKSIREAGIEVECFVHGAMCYCYSGMCLMSSILGGRSGNRGKCAQPCRLPYQVSQGSTSSFDTYTLSLKDMCTIDHIPALVEAGMDSFKIEGRMKRSEYASGVTALYRKYIDKYLADPDAEFIVSKQDKSILERLYMRSELHDGYLYKHNGKEMITKDAPSYKDLDESILADIRQKYLGYALKIPVSMYAYYEVGQEATLTVYTDDGMSITVTGPVVEAAQKAPATKDNVKKQLTKIGNTNFSLKDIEISIIGNVFLPKGVINSMRREALELLENAVISANFPELALRNCTKLACQQSSSKYSAERLFQRENTIPQKKFSVLVSTDDQLDVLFSHSIMKDMEYVYLEDSVLDIYLEKYSEKLKFITPVYTMPHILRKSHMVQMKEKLRKLHISGIKYILVRNVEEVALINNYNRSYGKTFHIISDASLYCWNMEAKAALSCYVDKITLPYELNSKELRPLRDEYTEQIIYGYIPLMTTANCVYKTNFSCKAMNGGGNKILLKDRYGKIFTTVTNCKYCYNTIYNSVPLSLHKKYDRTNMGTVRIQFSIEDKYETNAVLNYYGNWIHGIAHEFPIKEYTTAHENRRVE